MNNRELVRYVKKTAMRLKLVHMTRALQIAVFLGLLSALLLVVISRLFVLPYYEFYAYAAGSIFLLVGLLFSYKNMPNIGQAVEQLDRFTPHNLLLTSWKIKEQNELTEALTKQTAEVIPFSYQLFRKE